MFAEGFSRTGDLIELGMKTGVMKRSGAWISFGEEKIGQGKENAKRFLMENPSIVAEAERQIRAALGLENAGERKFSAE